uniref:Uncharacterized protein n=1 Tax=Oryza barthii TaxID=65489 RepID=A0A0D3FVT3_9ORYZ
MGRVGADGLLPRFIWAAPLVGVVGETARGRRHGGGSLSLSLPVVLWGRSISASGRCRCPVLYGQAGAPSKCGYP